MAKKKLSPSHKTAKKKRKAEHMIVFIHGKQKHVQKPPEIDGLDVDEFIGRNANPVWLHQNQLWEHIDDDENN